MFDSVDKRRYFLNSGGAILLAFTGALLLAHYHYSDFSLGMKCRSERKDWYDPLGTIECNYEIGELSCVVQPKSSHWAGTYFTLRPQYALDIKGDYAYIGSEFGVDVVYVGIDYLPIRFGWSPSVGRVRDLTIEDGNLLYLVDGEGLKLLDVGLSILPVSRGEVGLTSLGLALAVKDDYVFVIAGTKIEVIERVGDWTLATQTSFDVEQYCADIIIKENIAYLGCWEGIIAVDISDAENPIILERIPTLKPVAKLRKDDKFLYTVLDDDTTSAYLFYGDTGLIPAGKHNVDHWVRGVKYHGEKVFWINSWWMNIRKYD